MTYFMYIVDGKVFTDMDQPFETGWKEAKAEAEKKHCPIYRKTVKVTEEVYSGGCFFSKKWGEQNPDKITKW